MEVLKADSSEALKRTKEIFEKGGTIVYPTETFYALGVDPYNEDALKRLFSLKRRVLDKPVSILVRDRRMLLDVIVDMPAVAENLIKRFWPGPLTIIFEASPGLPELLTAATGKVGVRISNNPLAAGLLDVIGSPITATSANPSGAESPLNIEDVVKNFKNRVDIFLDGGILSGKLGSTIVDITGDRVELIREGEISADMVFTH